MHLGAKIEVGHRVGAGLASGAVGIDDATGATGGTTPDAPDACVAGPAVAVGYAVDTGVVGARARVGVGMTAVEDPTTLRGDAIAFTGPCEQRVLRNLALHFDVVAPFARATCWGGAVTIGQTPAVGGVEIDERVLIVT